MANTGLSYQEEKGLEHTDLESELQIILTNKHSWESRAVSINEIELIGIAGKTDISNLQKNQSHGRK